MDGRVFCYGSKEAGQTTGSVAGGNNDEPATDARRVAGGAARKDRPPGRVDGRPRSSAGDASRPSSGVASRSGRRWKEGSEARGDGNSCRSTT